MRGRLRFRSCPRRWRRWSAGSGRAGRTTRRASPERIGSAGRELSHYPDFDYLVVNERFDDALDELEAIVRAERARTQARGRRMAAFLDRLVSSR